MIASRDRGTASGVSTELVIDGDVFQNVQATLADLIPAKVLFLSDRFLGMKFIQIKKQYYVHASYYNIN